MHWKQLMKCELGCSRAGCPITHSIAAGAHVNQWLKRWFFRESPQWAAVASARRGTCETVTQYVFLTAGGKARPFAVSVIQHR